MIHMKTIGLVGGVSWESTAEYYRIINNSIKEKLGGLNSARIIINSINFNDIVPLHHAGKWDSAAEIIIEAAKKLEIAGADMILICSNTCNESADKVREALKIPVIHIADATGESVTEAKLKTVALVGTKVTMTGDYIIGKLKRNYGLTVLVPDEKDREIINSIIYDELCVGIVNEESKQKYMSIINSLLDEGAEGVILGCTEIPLLVSEKDFDVPVFDTTKIHALAAVNRAIIQE